MPASGGPPTNRRTRFATSADLARVAGRVAVAPGASAAKFHSPHTHVIELQPSHALAQVGFLVLAKQRWKRIGGLSARLMMRASDPFDEPTFRLGLPQLLRKELA
jgi:hypothetical protein